VNESEILRELGKRLDHIEDYLGRLGGVSGYPYRPYRGADPVVGPFDSAPASFGPAQGFGGPIAAAPSVGPASSRMPAEVLMLTTSGKMIQAIKLYRDLTGVGLKEAKAEVEAAAREAR